MRVDYTEPNLRDAFLNEYYNGVERSKIVSSFHNSIRAVHPILLVVTVVVLGFG